MRELCIDIPTSVIRYELPFEEEIVYDPKMDGDENQPLH